MSSIRWKARGRVVPGPDRPNGVPSYPAPPLPAAPPCAAPTRPARGVSGFWVRQVTTHDHLQRVSLCLDTQGEFALPARDYRDVARVTGWYHRLPQSRLAAPSCPACALGWTPQAQGTCTYRLEARVARFYAARPASSGFRSSGRPSAFVARSPPIGVTFPGKGGLIWPASFMRR